MKIITRELHTYTVEYNVATDNLDEAMDAILRGHFDYDTKELEQFGLLPLSDEVKEIVCVDERTFSEEESKNTINESRTRLGLTVQG